MYITIFHERAKPVCRTCGPRDGVDTLIPSPGGSVVSALSGHSGISVNCSLRMRCFPERLVHSSLANAAFLCSDSKIKCLLDTSSVCKLFLRRMVTRISHVHDTRLFLPFTCCVLAHCRAGQTNTHKTCAFPHHRRGTANPSSNKNRR